MYCIVCVIVLVTLGVTIVIISISAKKKTVCSFFLNGYCRFGDKCHNEHPRNGGTTVSLS